VRPYGDAPLGEVWVICVENCVNNLNLKNPDGVTDGMTDGRTDGKSETYMPPLRGA
jgi:hypothetical protein